MNNFLTESSTIVDTYYSNIYQTVLIWTTVSTADITTRHLYGRLLNWMTEILWLEICTNIPTNSHGTLSLLSFSLLSYSPFRISAFCICSSCILLNWLCWDQLVSLVYMHVVVMGCVCQSLIKKLLTYLNYTVLMTCMHVSLSIPLQQFLILQRSVSDLLCVTSKMRTDAVNVLKKLFSTGCPPTGPHTHIHKLPTANCI